MKDTNSDNRNKCNTIVMKNRVDSYGRNSYLGNTKNDSKNSSNNIHSLISTLGALQTHDALSSFVTTREQFKQNQHLKFFEIWIDFSLKPGYRVLFLHHLDSCRFL